MPMQWRDPYDPVECEAYGLAAALDTGPGLTVQGPAKDADINTIVQRFHIGEAVMPPAPDSRFYGDFRGVPDLRGALDQVREGQEKFAALEPRVRARFRNDPVEFLTFVADPDSFEEGVRLGLWKAVVKATVAPVVAPVAPVVSG